jgi:hypothetical protein
VYIYGIFKAYSTFDNSTILSVEVGRAQILPASRRRALRGQLRCITRPLTPSPAAPPLSTDHRLIRTGALRLHLFRAMGYQQFTRLFTTPYTIYMEVPDHCERLLGRVLVVSQFLHIIFFCGHTDFWIGCPLAAASSWLHLSLVHTSRADVHTHTKCYLLLYIDINLYTIRIAVTLWSERTSKRTLQMYSLIEALKEAL